MSTVLIYARLKSGEKKTFELSDIEGSIEAIAYVKESIKNARTILALVPPLVADDRLKEVTA